MSALYVLRLLDRFDGFKVEGLSGMFVQYYNPRVDWEMQYTLVVCDTPQEARVFTNPEEAWNYYQQVSPNWPTLKGEANRPLAAWNVELVPLDVRRSG